ncbi:MAG: hypothetical protein ABSA78_09005 [Candidatus Sulfotelmatobacter sp.]|jgi:hypothetical protein
MELAGQIVEWVRSVIEQWHGWVSGGVLAFGLEIAEKIWDFKVTKKLFLVILGLGFFWSIFASWRDEHTKVQGQRTYVRINFEASPATRVPLFQTEFHPWVNFGIQNDGSFRADKEYMDARLEIHAPVFPLPKNLDDMEQDPSSLEIENEVFQAFKKESEIGFKPRSTLLPGEHEFSTAYLSRKLSQSEVDELKDGRKLMYVVGYTKWSDGAGTHEWRSCAWIVPPADRQIIVKKCWSHQDFLETAED